MPLWFRNLSPHPAYLALLTFDSGCAPPWWKSGWYKVPTGGSLVELIDPDLRTLNQSMAWFGCWNAGGPSWGGTPNHWYKVPHNQPFGQCFSDDSNCNAQWDFQSLDFQGNFGLVVTLNNPPNFSLTPVSPPARPALPLPPVGLQPQNGATVSTTPYLFFRDPGANTPAAAGQFYYLVTQNNQIIDPSHQLTGGASTASPLTAPGLKWFYPLPDGEVTLQVWGQNVLGYGPPSSSTFMVASDRLPPAPTPHINASQQGENIVIAGQLFEPNKPVTILVEVQNAISDPLQDSRQGTFTVQSNASGAIPPQPFNPVPLFAGESTPYPGVIASGELVFVEAANTDAGTLQLGAPGVSNQISFNWQSGLCVSIS